VDGILPADNTPTHEAQARTEVRGGPQGGSPSHFDPAVALSGWSLPAGLVGRDAGDENPPPDRDVVGAASVEQVHLTCRAGIVGRRPSGVLRAQHRVAAADWRSVRLAAHAHKFEESQRITQREFHR
jgi:hypothetical protein